MAVKIIDVDSLDYKLDNNQKDEAISDFQKEVKTLLHLKEARAKNINYIQEAFDLHSQLWIVSDYCPGGSVHTLMKATVKPGLEEHFIIPIARELAIALMYVHQAGVIHRDVKCGNVLISEDGQVQLCDFGVAAIIENDASAKRQTIIGTPQWMAPEMWTDDMEVKQGYGTEVDCWAYGCTVYEMATGMPPNAQFHPSMLAQVLKTAPRLEGGNYSRELREFVAFILEERPEDRPSAEEIVRHPYIANTQKKYPTASVRQMMERYMQWERKGGQRASLFNPLGAAAPQPGVHEDMDDWNFSTTDKFEVDFNRRYSQFGIDAADFAAGAAPASDITVPSGQAKDVTPFEEAMEEAKAKRGEMSMDRLFNPSAEPYDYNTPVEPDHPVSDLPLRNHFSDKAATRESLIDLDMGGNSLDYQPTFDFSDVPTLRAPRANRNSFQAQEEEDSTISIQQDPKRNTMAWKFPTLTIDPVPASDPPPVSAPLPAIDPMDNPNRRTQDWTFSTAQPIASPPDEASDFTFPPANISEVPPLAPGFRPTLKHTVTEPLGAFGDFEHAAISIPSELETPAITIRESRPMIDLDLDLGNTFQHNFDFDDPADIPRPSTAASIASIANSARTDITANPFFLEDDELQAEKEQNRTSFHRQYKSEPGHNIPTDLDRHSLHVQAPSIDTRSLRLSKRLRGTSLSSTASSDRASDSDWSRDRDYRRQMEAHTRTQMINGLSSRSNSSTHVSSSAYPSNSHGHPHHHSHHHSRSNSQYLADPDAWHSRYPTSALDSDSDFAALTRLSHPGGGSGFRPVSDAFASDTDTGDDASTYPNHPSNPNSIHAYNNNYPYTLSLRTRPRATTATSTLSTLSYDSSDQSRDRDRALSSLPPGALSGDANLSFPRLAPPSEDALAEGVDPEVLVREVDRLFADLERGMRVAAQVLARSQSELSIEEEGVVF